MDENKGKSQLINSFSGLEKQKIQPQQTSGVPDIQSNPTNSASTAMPLGSVTNLASTNKPQFEDAGQNIAKPNIVNTDSFQEKPGGIRLRASAGFFDSLFIGIPLNIFFGISIFLFGVIPGGGNTAANVLMYLAYLAIGVGYHLYFIVNKGATPGKDLYGLKVIDVESRNNTNYKRGFIREFVNRGLVGIPILGGLLLVINFFVILFSKNKRGIHDKLAKTQVVVYKKHWSLKKQLGVFILLVVFLAVPNIFIVPKLIETTKKTGNCVAQCFEESNNNRENATAIYESCVQTCSE